MKEDETPIQFRLSLDTKRHDEDSKENHHYAPENNVSPNSIDDDFMEYFRNIQSKESKNGLYDDLDGSGSDEADDFLENLYDDMEEGNSMVNNMSGKSAVGIIDYAKPINEGDDDSLCSILCCFFPWLQNRPGNTIGDENLSEPITFSRYSKGFSIGTMLNDELAKIRQLRFDYMTHVFEYEASTDFEDPENLWWTKTDFRIFLRNNVLITRKKITKKQLAILNGDPIPKSSILKNSSHKAEEDECCIEDGEEWWHKYGHSRRGLEKMLSSTTEGKERQDNVYAISEAVLEEQARQNLPLAKKDPEKIRAVSLQHSSWANEIARAAGASDAHAVQTDFDESRKTREAFLLQNLMLQAQNCNRTMSQQLEKMTEDERSPKYIDNCLKSALRRRHSKLRQQQKEGEEEEEEKKQDQQQEEENIGELSEGSQRQKRKNRHQRPMSGSLSPTRSKSPKSSMSSSKRRSSASRRSKSSRPTSVDDLEHNPVVKTPSPNKRQDFETTLGEDEFNDEPSPLIEPLKITRNVTSSEAEKKPNISPLKMTRNPTAGDVPDISSIQHDIPDCFGVSFEDKLHELFDTGGKTSDDLFTGTKLSHSEMKRKRGHNRGKTWDPNANRGPSKKLTAQEERTRRKSLVTIPTIPTLVPLKSEAKKVGFGKNSMAKRAAGFGIVDLSDVDFTAVEYEDLKDIKEAFEMLESGDNSRRNLFVRKSWES